jgi:hypothetical protein
MVEKQSDVEYLYRYRSWDRNIWYSSRREEFTAEELAAGWGDWEFIDEQKYNEICGYIAWDRPCHYQAEKLLVTVVGHESFDPVAYVAQEKISIEQSRKEYRERNAPQNNSALSMSSSQSSAPVVDGYGLLNLAEGIVRSIGNGINSTVETAGECVSAIGDGLKDICD